MTQPRGDAKGGLGSYNSRQSMLSPHWKVKSDIFGDFWLLYYAENCNLAPSSEESAPLGKVLMPPLIPLDGVKRKLYGVPDSVTPDKIDEVLDGELTHG